MNAKQPKMIFFQTHTFKKVFLFIFFSLFLSVGWAQPPTTPPKFVYKLSTTSPDTIFQSGFSTTASVENFIQHMAGVYCERHIDGFVSTTTRENMLDLTAHSYLFNRRDYHLSNIPIYIYTIRATNDFYNSEITVNHLGNINPSPFTSRENVEMARALAGMEAEYVIPNNVAASLIYSATVYNMNPGGIITVHTVSNPNYQDASTTANTGPYTGDDGLAPQPMQAPMVSGIPPLSACQLPEIDVNPHFEPFLLYILNNDLFSN